MHRPALLLVALLLASCNEASSASPRPVGVPLLTFTDADTSRSISVRYYTSQRLELPALHLDEVSRRGRLQAYARTALASVREIENAGRWVYAFDVDDLEPGDTYHFVVSSGGRALFGERSFRTLPADGRLRVVVGGDVAPTDDSFAMARAVALLRPDVVALGGDLAYANGMPANAPRWDALLSLLDGALTDERGRMVPVIAAIGNHEVRVHLGEPRPHHAPFWYALFSDLRDRDRREETYFLRRLGAASLFVLDSGHVSSHGGLQREWLARALAAEARRPFRIALYHVPLWPTVRDFDGEASAEGRAHWLPLFDRHRLTVAFENHEHTLKRTHPLKDGRVVDEGGTLYLGDGCFGAGCREPRGRRFYLKRAERRQHAWVIDVGPEELRLKAVAPDGAVLDELRFVARKARSPTADRPAATPAADRSPASSAPAPPSPDRPR